MAAFVASFIFVVLAEMGDKTQLLAMAFATRYHPGKVLLAVFLATLVNHALAVAFGRFLTAIVPFDIISFLAAVSFIGFGLWTIRGDTLSGEERRQTRFGPVVTVAVAFFLAEMGDKTQLATVSLAAAYRNAGHVLAGTTLGMVVADAFGIIAGVILRRHIPEKGIKYFAASVFILFGLAGIYTVLAKALAPLTVAAILLAVAIAAGYGGYRIARSERKGG